MKRGSCETLRVADEEADAGGKTRRRVERVISRQMLKGPVNADVVELSRRGGTKGVGWRDRGARDLLAVVVR